MIKKEDFIQKNYTEKYKILTGILEKIEPKHIFADLRDFFALVKNPSEESLVQVFEIIESLLKLALSKEIGENTEKLSFIQQKLKTLKNLESEKSQYLEGSLDELLSSLN